MQIANRIKSKGLQKLRWYCQLCQKQCRDENGFKCHQTSDSHRRQMEVFGMNPKRVIEGYSQEFESLFMEHLRRAYPNARVLAKNVRAPLVPRLLGRPPTAPCRLLQVYNEFISDRNHIHMNSTKWLTLTEFVKYLGREGKCKVDETEKGWYITYIHEDMEDKLAKDRSVKRAVHEKEEEERLQAALKAQVHHHRLLPRAASRGHGRAVGHCACRSGMLTVPAPMPSLCRGHRCSQLVFHCSSTLRANGSFGAPHCAKLNLVCLQAKGNNCSISEPVGMCTAGEAGPRAGRAGRRGRGCGRG
jgi:hypothetical protein